VADDADIDIAVVKKDFDFDRLVCWLVLVWFNLEKAASSLGI